MGVGVDEGADRKASNCVYNLQSTADLCVGVVHVKAIALKKLANWAGWLLLERVVPESCSVASLCRTPVS